jgi:hypothetical protein
VRPGHPFAREGEYNVAVLEFGCHCNRKEISHPKERHPKDPEEVEVSSKRKTREVDCLDLFLSSRDIRSLPHDNQKPSRIAVQMSVSATKSGTH